MRAHALLVLAACGPELVVIPPPPAEQTPATELLAIDSTIYALELPEPALHLPNRYALDGKLRLDALVYAGSLADNRVEASPQPIARGAIRSDYEAYSLTVENGVAASWKPEPEAPERLAPYRLRVETSTLATGSGEYHMCVTTRDHRAYCWGDDGFNQLGRLGDRTLVPREVPGLDDVQEITLGIHHTCVLDRSGYVDCFGDNVYAQLGIDPTLPAMSAIPVRIAGIPEAVQIRAGGNQTCALSRDGRVFCWGSYFRTPIRDGAPHEIPFPEPLEKIAAGTYGVCGIARGTVYCAGLIVDPELPATFCSSTTTAVDGRAIAIDGRAIDLEAGDSFACALLESKELYCWGCNTRGQIGTGEETEVEPPTRTLENVRAFDLGWWFGCAILENDQTVCWGYDDRGQLGTGRAATVEARPPGTVAGLGEKPRQIRAQWVSACALLESGEINCWGEGSHGELGNGGMQSTDAASAVLF